MLINLIAVAIVALLCCLSGSMDLFYVAQAMLITDMTYRWVNINMGAEEKEMGVKDFLKLLSVVILVLLILDLEVDYLDYIDSTHSMAPAMHYIGRVMITVVFAILSVCLIVLPPKERRRGVSQV